MTEEKEKIIRSCKGCAFANKVGKTQVGCDIDKLETFRDSGVKVVEGRDDDEEFFIVERFCQFFRDENWSRDVKNISLKAQVNKEVEISYGFIILHEHGNSLDKVRSTFKDIQAQKIAPKYLTLVVSNKEENPFNVRHVCHEHLDYPHVKRSIPFSVVTMADGEATHLQMIDEAFERSLNGYYIVFRSGEKIPPNLATKLNDSLNNKMDQVSMVRPRDGDVNGLTVQCVVHKFLMGNRTISLAEKVEIFAEETNRASFVKDWGEVYG